MVFNIFKLNLELFAHMPFYLMHLNRLQAHYSLESLYGIDLSTKSPEECHQVGSIYYLIIMEP